MPFFWRVLCIYYYKYVNDAKKFLQGGVIIVVFIGGVQNNYIISNFTADDNY